MDGAADSSCTCGNFGPGFDAMSLALDAPGDRVRIAEASEDSVVVRGMDAADLPVEFLRNCASVAADHLRRALGLRAGMRVEVEKRVPPGSGLGSSASSCAAGALAFAAAFGREVGVSEELLLQAAAAGERAVSGDHRDDVAAALFGGLALVEPGSDRVLRVAPPRNLHVAVIRPLLRLETKRMREVLPGAVPLPDVVRNLSAVARMVDAFHRGDVEAIGRALGGDRVATPHRSPFIPRFEASRDAALGAGASGYAISGSGPAMIAVAGSRGGAEAALGASLDVYRASGVPAEGFVCQGRAPREVAGRAPRVH